MKPSAPVSTPISSAPATPCGCNSAAFSHRLIALCDGRPGLRQPLEVRASVPADIGPDGTAGLPIIEFVASNETLDRYGEILVADGWRLENYRRNPVFQNAHQYGDVLFTLGKALVTEVRIAPGAGTGIVSSAYLFQRVQFATDLNPAAKIAYGLYRDRYLHAVSVGFIPLRWEEGGPEDPFRRRYLEQELLEVSAVGLPANPNALQLALREGALGVSDLKDLIEFVYASLAPKTRNEFEPTTPHPGPLPIGWGEGDDGSRSGKVPGGQREVSDPANSSATSRAPSSSSESVSNQAVPVAQGCSLDERERENRLLQLARDLRRVLSKA